MSVQTTWDEKNDRLRTDLKSIKRQLYEMQDEDVWGYEEITKEYHQKLNNLYHQIQELLQ